MKIIIYFFISFVFCSCFGKRPTIDSGHEGKPIPSISLLLMDSTTTINLKDLSNNKPMVLYYFSPLCPYCRTLTKDIINNMENLKDINFYLISAFPFNDIKKYMLEYHLEKYTNINVTRDYNQYFRNYYKAQGVPCLAIYGKDKLLKEVLMGIVSSDLIKDIAFE